MSSFQTTEILFNSPALHSLKRDQLVKLCKIHSVKASGKNVELIERLKRVAEDLSKGSLSIGSGNHDTDNGDMEIDEAVDNGGDNKENYADRKIGSTTVVVNPPRPSEKWEVMESIAECENEDNGSRNGTLRSIASNREFGTGGSKSSTISSIKALASSLGLKRSTSAKSNAHASGTRGDRFPPATDDELSKHAIPYTRLPVPSPNQIPQTDHFSDFSHFGANPPTPSTLSKFDFNNREDTAPLPGHVLRPGAPAPNNARLSLGDARFSLGYGLATPRKSASGATTTIRLVSSSSMIGITNFPGPSTSTLDIENSSTPHLKPWNTAFDLVLGSPSGPGQGENVKIYPDLPMEDVPVSSTTVEPSQTLSDGFPHLSGAKSQAFVFGSPLPQHRVSNAQFQTAAASVLEEMNRRLLADGVEAVGPSLVSNLRPGAGGHLTPGTQKVYTDRQIKPLRKSFGAHAVQKEIQQKFEKAHQDQFDGMESIAGYLDRKNNSSLVGKAPVGTSLSIESVQVGKKRKSSAIDDGRQAPAKRPSTRVISNSRRTVPGGFGDEDEDEEAPVGKKPRVEFSGKDDTGAKEVVQSALEKSEKEREAIRRKLEMNRARRRSSAANGRASMGRGRVSVGKLLPKQAASKSRFGFLSNAAKSIVKGVWGGGKKTPAVVPPKLVFKAPSSTTSTAKLVPSTGVTEAKAKVTPSGTQRKFSATDSGTSPRNRDVSNVGTMNSLGSVATAIHSSRSRSPLPSFAAPTKSSSVRSSATGTTSTRNSSIAVSSRVSRTSTTYATSSRVSSLGVRGTLDPNRVSSTTSSRLLAPTASSLAKAASLNKLKSDALNVPAETPFASSPSSSKIFSKPLVVPKGSGLPSPVRSGRSQTVTREITVKQRSLSGRKPRISRSKVIAKLASQRNPSGRSEPSASTDYTGPSAVGLAAKRSSLGVGVHKAPRKSMGAARRSHIGVSGTRSSEASVLLSAKKRARQSEYARRKSRAATGGAEPMKVDA
ncbi:hypothetical protein EV359DRAFT_50570 [Lentinula novae-zelandiae]|nr:hypothetical protein EV359DRAFT_50570 [Lentinula novae-zelandiae]